MKNSEKNEVQTQDKTNGKLTHSQRFAEMVALEFGKHTSTSLSLSSYQQRLIQGYFIMIDRALKIAEDNRIRKNNSNKDHQYDNELAYDWNNVNILDLALDAVHYARMGLDMQEKNHLFPIPYANKKTNKYDISFTVGYNGVRYIAEKYAAIPPKNVTVELVYSTDVFKPLKKSRANAAESYEFEITSPFDRGEVLGGFGYIEYDDETKNQLIIMSAADIKKRAGKNANPEFWGTKATGKQTTVWEGGKKVFVDTDGWYEEMCRKTIIREVYSGKHIPLDPSKFDDGYQHLKEREVIYAQAEIENEAAESRKNAEAIDIPKQLPEPTAAVNINTGEVKDIAEAAADNSGDEFEPLPFDLDF